MTEQRHRFPRDVATTARRGLKEAQRAGRLPAGLGFRVTSRNQGLSAAVEISVLNLDDEFLFGENPDDRRYTDAAWQLATDIRAELTDAYAWDDGVTNFVTVYFGKGRLSPPALDPQRDHRPALPSDPALGEARGLPSQTAYLAAVIELLASRRQPTTGEVATSFFNRGLDQAAELLPAARGHALGVQPRTPLDHEMAKKVAEIAQVEVERRGSRTADHIAARHVQGGRPDGTWGCACGWVQDKPHAEHVAEMIAESKRALLAKALIPKDDADAEADPR